MTSVLLAGPDQLLPADVRDYDPEVDLPGLKIALSAFVTTVLRKWQPDLLIVHGRKGAASLRVALGDDLGEQLSWDRVLSSESVDAVGGEFFAGKRVVLFDDMIRTGRGLARVLNALPRDERAPSWVGLAIFASHHDLESTAPAGIRQLDMLGYFTSLDDGSYVRLRTALVALMQDEGSLLLDTEHIEVRFTYRGSFRRLHESLAQSGSVTVFRSGIDRTNLTVLYDEEMVGRRLARDLPTVSGVGVVAKCRVIQRTATEFALLPICLPNVPKELPMDSMPDADRALIVGVPSPGASVMFHVAALHASLLPLEWALGDLHRSLGRDIEVRLPSQRLDRGGAYALSHLLASLPSLNVSTLVDRVWAVDARSRRDTIHRQSERFAYFLTKKEGRDQGLVLLQAIGDAVATKDARFEAMTRMFGGRSPFSAAGITMGELWLLGDALGFDRALSSALVDVLIDSADLVTRVEEVSTARGIEFARTFRPDSEIVRGLLARLSRLIAVPEAAHRVAARL